MDLQHTVVAPPEKAALSPGHRIHGWNERAPNRRRLLAMRHDDAERRRTIVQRLNWLEVEHRGDFRRTGDLSLLSRPMAGQHYQYFTEDSLFEYFMQIKNQWDRSQDATDLGQLFKDLIDRSILPKVTKIVYFGNEPLLERYEAILGTSDSAKLIAAENCTQIAAVMTIADMLNTTRRDNPPVRMYTANQGLKAEDLGVMNRLGFTNLNNAYGYYEGVVEIDEETVVFGFGLNTWIPLEWGVLELTRPAAILWDFKSLHGTAPWRYLKYFATIAKEYAPFHCNAFADAWEPGKEAEIVRHKTSPDFGVPCPPDRFAMLSDIGREEYERLKQEHRMGSRPLLRRRRLLAADLKHVHLLVRKRHFGWFS
ncbi:hypothetical protein F4780DRAFT_776454 [Xylariomycetidae sp. FL0641]|nr:hypothetical protein F4780DRAFT_776454 [Xylariomycetidae sp. FL0641]